MTSRGRKLLAAIWLAIIVLPGWWVARWLSGRPEAGLPAQANGEPGPANISPEALTERPLYPIRAGGKMGYMDRSGRVVIEPVFDNAWVMHEGYGNILVGEKRGLVDRTGKVVVPPRYYFAGGLEDVQEGLVVFKSVDSAQYGFLDPATGAEAISARFDYARGFSNGLAMACLTGKAGYIDHTGSFVIPPTFDYAWPFSEGFACVRIGEEAAFIDKHGAFAFGRRFGCAHGFSEGLAAVNVGGRWPDDPREEIGGKWGFINREGRIVIEPSFDDVGAFSEGLAKVQVGDRWGFTDKEGRVVIEPQYQWAEAFSEGMAAVADKSFDFGYINRAGQTVIESRFHDAGPFQGGLAQVGMGRPIEIRKYGYIDRTGRYVREPSR